ncbi:MAG: hypothetical protein K0R16_2411 [Nitrososphaeraceae archaeon]|nr:hypothetical protein [Nitrososphaeraceae archaeon]
MKKSLFSSPLKTFVVKYKPVNIRKDINVMEVKRTFLEIPFLLIFVVILKMRSFDCHLIEYLRYHIRPPAINQRGSSMQELLEQNLT